jgi:hypothetical protein
VLEASGDGLTGIDLRNLLVVDGRATVYSVAGGVIKKRAPVTIHLTYSHVTEPSYRPVVPAPGHETRSPI